MNLYAINAAFAPYAEVSFILAKNDEEAINHGIYVAAYDAVKNYGSPTADVYLIARDVEKVGTAEAKDAPECWKWAHPGVEKAIAAFEGVVRGVAP